MADKSYRVHYFQTTVGDSHLKFRDTLTALHPQGHTGVLKNLGVKEILGRKCQLREFGKLPNSPLWAGVFCLLREDAPNKIDLADKEQSLDLDPGDRLVEKCHFLYDLKADILVWQLNVQACWPGKVSMYLGELLNQKVELLSILDAESLKRLLTGDIKTFELKVARPAAVPNATPTWNQDAFDLMRSVDGANIKINVSAGTGHLKKVTVANILGWARSSEYTKTLKVQMEGDREVIDLLANRITGFVITKLVGHYPEKSAVISALRENYTTKGPEIIKAISSTSGDS